MLARQEEGVGSTARPTDILAACLEEVREILFQSDVDVEMRGRGGGVVDLESGAAEGADPRKGRSENVSRTNGRTGGR